MGFVQFLIKKLVGYDILKSEKELRSSLANAQRELSSATHDRNRLMTEAENKQREIITTQKAAAKIKEELHVKSKEYE